MKDYEFYSHTINNGVRTENAHLDPIGFFWIGLLSICTYKTVKALVANLYKKTTLFENLKIWTGSREVIIVRGVPGCGKNNYIYEREHESDGNFAIVSNDDFFTKNKDYTFNRKDISKAENSCFEQFSNFLNIGVPRIYVENVNNKNWMYVNYILLASYFKYNVSIVEIECPDEQHLNYFNRRSTHNVPMSYSKNVFHDWDEDKNSNKVDAYIGDYDGPPEGDCLPPYPSITTKDLDIELDVYNNTYINTGQECAIDTGTDEDDDSTDSDYIPYKKRDYVMSENNSCDSDSESGSNSETDEDNTSVKDTGHDDGDEDEYDIVQHITKNSIKCIRKKRQCLIKRVEVGDEPFYCITCDGYNNFISVPGIVGDYTIGETILLDPSTND